MTGNMWAEFAKATEERMNPLTFEEKRRAFYEKFPDCEFHPYIVEPCEGKPFEDYTKPIRIIVKPHGNILRQWLAKVFLQLAFRLGKFTYEGLENA